MKILNAVTAAKLLIPVLLLSSTRAYTAAAAPSEDDETLMLWLRAEDAEGEETEDDEGNTFEVISSWEAHKGGTLTVPAGKTAPEKRSVKGKAVISFDGVDNCLSAQGLINETIGSSAFSIFLVSQSADREFGITGNMGDGSGNVPRLYLTRGNFVYNELESSAGINTINKALEISEYFFDGTGMIITRKNGTLQVTNRVKPANGFGGGALAIPFISAGKSRKGDVFEILIYNVSLNDIKRGEVESYLISKYLGTVKPVVATVPDAEKLLPLNENFLNKIKARPVASAEMIRQDNGLVQLVINNKIEPFYMAAQHPWGAVETMYQKPFVDGGINTFFVNANLAFYHEELGYKAPIRYMPSFWVSKNNYNKDSVERVLLRPLQVNPDANILIWLAFNTYPAWGDENPDEIMQNDKGEKCIVSTHFLRFDSKPPDRTKQETYGWSFFSEKFRQDTGTMLQEYIRTAEASVPGRAVIGYFLGGGRDLQAYFWHAPDYALMEKPELWGDYSPAGRKAWTKWLEKKYGEIQKLNTAWRTKHASFAAVQPPAAVHLAGGAQLADPSHIIAAEWKRFLAWGRADMLSYFAGVVRKASGRKIIIGASAGDGGARRELCSAAMMIRDPDLDFLVHQPAYNQRTPPAVGGFNAMLASYQANGKMFLADMDHATYYGQTAPKDSTIGSINIGSAFHGIYGSIGDWRAVLRKEFGVLWSQGAGGSYDQMIGQRWAYMDPPIPKEMKFIADSWKTIKAPALINPAAETAVIYDEDAVHLLRNGAILHFQWIRAQQNELLQSGVPYNEYYLEDLIEGKIPKHRMYLFINLLDIRPGAVQAVNILKKENSTLVFLGLTGYANMADNPDLVHDVTGFTLVPFEEDCMKASAENEYFSGIDPASEGLKNNSGFQLGLRDGGASILANYAGTEKGALAVKDFKTSKSVFVGSVFLSKNLFNACARYAGAWQITQPSVVTLAVTDNFLMLHALVEKTITIELKKAGKLTAYPPHTIVSPRSLRHKLKLTEGETYWFTIE